MKLANRFLSSFGSLIYCVLSCFDRVVFKGYLPFHNEGYLNSWVDYTPRLRRTDFIKQLDQKSQEPVDHAKVLSLPTFEVATFARTWAFEHLVQGRTVPLFQPTVWRRWLPVNFHGFSRKDVVTTGAKALAEKARRPCEYRQGWFRKERFIQDVARRDNVSEGLIAVLCAQEACRTVMWW